MLIYESRLNQSGFDRIYSDLLLSHSLTRAEYFYRLFWPV